MKIVSIVRFVSSISLRSPISLRSNRRLASIRLTNYTSIVSSLLSLSVVSTSSSSWVMDRYEMIQVHRSIVVAIGFATHRVESILRDLVFAILFYDPKVAILYVYVDQIEYLPSSSSLSYKMVGGGRKKQNVSFSFFFFVTL